MKLIVVSTLCIIISCNAMEHAHKINEFAWKQDEEELEKFNAELLTPNCTLESIEKHLTILETDLATLAKSVNDLVSKAPLKQLDLHMIRLIKTKRIYSALSRVHSIKLSQQIQEIQLSDNNGE